MKTKQILMLALFGTVLVGCSESDLVSDATNSELSQNEMAINFAGGANKMTRATSNTGTDAVMLDRQFKIYGVKGASTTFNDVFKNYILWNATTATTSNPDGDWEYVGPATQTYGSDGNTIGQVQTIKYWDYSTSEYHFVAGSPVLNFTYAKNDNGDIASATVTGLAGHLNPNTGTAITTNPVYIANPVKVVKTNYNNEVTFSFKRQQTFVRVGIFETIPGYRISDIEFYTMSGTDWAAPSGNKNIVLASKTSNYFQGATAGSAIVTYDWTTPSYTFDYQASGLRQAQNWYGGAMTGVPATTSTETTVANLYGSDADMAATGYFTVIPMKSAAEAQPMLIKCDYTLTAEDGNGETIKVTGATAAIPAAFCKWNPNTSYTYLFKISDNTNGTTGNPDFNDPEGLFPITFDAAVIAEQSGTEQGTITTVTTPSITTYQEGSVTDEGIKYTKDKAIYVTAQNDETGELNTLSALTSTPAAGMVQVYKLAGEMTEADLQLTAPTTTFTTTIGAAAFEINGQSVAAGKYLTFTPDVAGYYAVRYYTADNASTYKVIKVE